MPAAGFFMRGGSGVGLPRCGRRGAGRFPLPLPAWARGFKAAMAAGSYQAAAWRWSSSAGMRSRADSCVAARTTGGACPARAASSQRTAHRHQRSPATRPGKPHCGCGVTRSLPTDTVKARKSAVITAQTVCAPGSEATDRQQPSRRKPVSGSWEQATSGAPRTLRSGGRSAGVGGR